MLSINYMYAYIAALYYIYYKVCNYFASFFFEVANYPMSV